MGSQCNDLTRVRYRYFYRPSLHTIYHSVIETHPCGRKGSANMKNSSFRQLGKILNKTIYIVPEINASLKYSFLGTVWQEEYWFSLSLTRTHYPNLIKSCRWLLGPPHTDRSIPSTDLIKLFYWKYS